jgi:hypothetical protein
VLGGSLGHSLLQVAPINKVSWKKFLGIHSSVGLIIDPKRHINTPSSFSIQLITGSHPSSDPLGGTDGEPVVGDVVGAALGDTVGAKAASSASSDVGTADGSTVGEGEGMSLGLVLGAGLGHGPPSPSGSTSCIFSVGTQISTVRTRSSRQNNTLAPSSPHDMTGSQPSS